MISESQAEALWEAIDAYTTARLDLTLAWRVTPEGRLVGEHPRGVVCRHATVRG